MPDAPKVSVVIPTYNAPSLLIETLQSVFAQTYRDYEIIVVNDGSTDDTLDRLKPFASRIRIVTQPNGGIGVARNRCIDEARGTYIAFVDHDDIWHAEKLAVQVSYLDAHPQCAACCVPWTRTSDGAMRPANPDALRDADGIVRRPLRKLVEAVPFLTTSALMVRRDQLGSARYGTDRGSIEDVPFHIQLFARGPIGIAGDTVLMTYRDHATNFSRRASFSYRGIATLRRMDAQGAFDELDAQGRNDLAAYLAFIAKGALVCQLGGGYRLAALKVYLREFPAFIRHGYAKLLAVFPFVLGAPRTLIRKRWPDWD